MSEQKEYIEKDAAQLYAENIREYLNELYDDGWITITDIDWRVLMSLILAINDTPPAEVKPVVRGEWVKVDDDLYRCSHCHSEIEMRDIYIAECKYCLVCGAEMRNRGEIDENAKRI